MTGVPTVEHYELGDPAFCADPYPRWAELRARGPVLYWPATGAYVVVGFDAAHEALAAGDVFSPSRRYSAAATGGEPAHPAIGRLESNGLFHLAPDDHLRVRRLINPAFTPRTVERLRPGIAALAADVLAPLRDGGRLDLGQVAGRVPMEVMGSYLGLDAEAHAALCGQAETIFALTNPFTAVPMEEVGEAVDAMTPLLLAEFEDRRRAPRDDLLTNLVQANEDGDRLSDDELLVLVIALLMAGAETTTNLLTLGSLALAEHPEQYRLLLDGDVAPADAVDEMLRWSYIGFLIARFAITDATLAGVAVPKGAMLMVAVGAALRDPAAVADPDRFDLRREPAPPLAFGVGVRHCVGNGLARATGEEFFAQLVALGAPVHVDGGLGWRSNPVLRGLDHLPLSL